MTIRYHSIHTVSILCFGLVFHVALFFKVADPDPDLMKINLDTDK